MKKLLFAISLLLPLTLSAQLKVNAGRDTTFCESCVSKGTVVLGSQLKVEHGTPPYSYKWTTKYHYAGNLYMYAKNLLVDSTQTMPTFNSSLPNKVWQPFIVEVKDANQQIARDTINIRFSGFIFSASTFTFFQHMGDEIEFKYSNIGGGIEPYKSYSWSPSVGLSTPNAPTTKCRVIGSQRYTLRVVDSVGCVTEDPSYDVYVPTNEAPTLGATDSWNVASFVWGRQTSIKNFTINGDTLIGNKLYKSVYMTNDSLFLSGKAKYAFGMRNEQSKWYFRFSNASNEQLLYDFSLTKSDTFSVNIEGNLIKYSIIKVDTIPLNGQYRKRLYLGLYNPNGESNYIYNDWIEGIGSTQGLIYNSPYLMDSGTELICFSKNGNLIYLSPNSKSCGLSDGIEPVLSKNDLIISQDHSKSGVIQVKANHEITAMVIYNTHGKTIKRLNPYSNIATVSLHNEPKGVYILRIHTADGISVRKIVKR